MAIWILTSVEHFYNNSKEIINRSSSSFYIMFYSMNSKMYKLIKIEENNENQISEMINNGLFDYSYRHFFILTCDKAINLFQNIYDQTKLLLYLVEGRGGRESLDEIECIYLTILEKKSDKSVNSLYSKIVTNLKKKPNFKQGFNGNSLMAKRALYDVRIINKIKKFNLKNPLSSIKIE